MPLYEYLCESCGLTFEVIHKFSDAPVETCKHCSGKVRRLLSAPAIHFKGTGWYITDYARKGKTDGDRPPAASSSSSSEASKTPSETKSSETAKPAATEKSSGSSDKPAGGSTTT
jgi:putative FmdB family regulatory protein